MSSKLRDGGLADGGGSSKIPAVPYAVAQLARYKHDIELFAEECVFTNDAVDKVRPIKRLPPKASAPHIYYCIRQIHEEPLLAVVKHRRMLLTWSMCIVALHDAMFMEERFNAMVSKKEEDSDELVRRCYFIWQNIPEDKLPVKPPAIYKFTSLKFPDQGSEIKGVAQGRDQLRQYTCSRVMCDEMAFWPQCRDTFTSLKPTLEGGGRVTLVSTRYPGFFKNIIEDTIDEDAA